MSAEAWDADAVREFVLPKLRTARQLGEIPELGDPQWVGLDDRDPRKWASLLRVGLIWMEEREALAATLAEDLAERDREAVARLRQASHDLSRALNWKATAA